MRKMCATLFAAIILAAPTHSQEKLVPMVSYDGLVREVQKHRGKVVLVDIWAEY